MSHLTEAEYQALWDHIKAHPNFYSQVFASNFSESVKVLEPNLDAPERNILLGFIASLNFATQDYANIVSAMALLMGLKTFMQSIKNPVTSLDQALPGAARKRYPPKPKVLFAQLRANADVDPSSLIISQQDLDIKRVVEGQMQNKSDLLALFKRLFSKFDKNGNVIIDEEDFKREFATFKITLEKFKYLPGIFTSTESLDPLIKKYNESLSKKVTARAEVLAQQTHADRLKFSAFIAWLTKKPLRDYFRLMRSIQHTRQLTDFETKPTTKPKLSKLSLTTSSLVSKPPKPGFPDPAPSSSAATPAISAGRTKDVEFNKRFSDLQSYYNAVVSANVADTSQTIDSRYNLIRMLFTFMSERMKDFEGTKFQQELNKYIYDVISTLFKSITQQINEIYGVGLNENDSEDKVQLDRIASYTLIMFCELNLSSIEREKFFNVMTMQQPQEQPFNVWQHLANFSEGIRDNNFKAYNTIDEFIAKSIDVKDIIQACYEFVKKLQSSQQSIYENVEKMKTCSVSEIDKIAGEIIQQIVLYNYYSPLVSGLLTYAVNMFSVTNVPRETVNEVLKIHGDIKTPDVIADQMAEQERVILINDALSTMESALDRVSKPSHHRKP